ncbi:MAG: diguanylate cyclase [Treponema sp.]|nr:diguanylate cyclase [Treponema sp.]
MHKKIKKVSIRIKILQLALNPLIFLSLILGFSSVILVNRLAKEDAKNLMVQVCEKETARFDNKLNLVKQSVSIIDDYIKEIIKIGEFKVFSENFEKAIREFSISVSNQTTGARAVYFRYNPEIVGTGTGGFFYIKTSEESEFVEELPTDLFSYSFTDIEHVGWFYVPKASKKPLWMKPYLNKDLNILMISYIVPVYFEDEFLGIIGMDIDFSSLLKAEKTITLYETGNIALVDLADRLIYQPETNEVPYPKKLPNKLYNHITTINKASELLDVSDGVGNESVICCRRLSNGMMLYVNVPKSEIFASRNRLVLFIIILSITILGITIYKVREHTTQIIEPINHLVEVTNYYASGDWSHSYLCESGDEIQRLSESIEIMAKNTQEYLSNLNDLARTDGLTNMKNKTSYLELVKQIKQNRHNNYEEYSIVVMDLNLLKKANDNFGHEAGDALLKEAASYINRSFRHSSTFRIGGDEFVAILVNEDNEKRNQICDHFEKNMNYEFSGSNGIKLSISYGLASYPSDAKDYDELFKIADDRMYAKKKEMKMERKD